MAGTYDGSIRIDTRIDSAGFNSGVRNISAGLGRVTRALKGMAIAAGIAFSVKAIIDFGKASVTAAKEFENAMIGLQSIVEGQGRSFQKAKSFIEDYISDGLMPATEAATAYKNLAMRGYTDDQIQQTMVALKDSAAFGRQGSLSLGQAVASATEGLKNENSILVDNAGVTKNVSVMWKEYAASIGTTVGNLTKQQKIQAEVNGILEETRFQIGDAAKISDTYSGQVLHLGFAFNNLKIAVGNALMPILQRIIPPIIEVVTWFMRLANIVAQVTAALFGKSVKVNNQVAESAAGAAGSTAGLADAEKEAGDAAEKAGKQAKGALAAFDQLNVLSQQSNSGTSGATAPDAGFGGIGGDVEVDDVGNDIEVNPKLLESLKRLRELLEPAIDKAKELWEALKAFAGVVGKGLKWFLDEVLTPLSEWVISEAVPRFLDTLRIAIKLLTLVIGKGLDILMEWYEKFLKPIAEYAGEKFLDFWDKLNGYLQEFYDMLEQSDIWEDIKTILLTVSDLLKPVLKFLIDIWSWVSKLVLSKAFSLLKRIFKELEQVLGLIAALLRGDFNDAWAHFQTIIENSKLGPLIDKVSELKGKFVELTAEILDWANNWKEKLDEFKTTWGEKISAWWDNDVKKWFTLEQWQTLFSNIVTSLKTKLGEFVSTWTADITNWWDNDVKKWFTLDHWKETIGNIKTALESTLGEFVSTWKTKIQTWWEEDVSPWFTADKWKELGTNMKEGLVNGFKGVVGGVIGLLNKIIDGFESLVNTHIVDNLNSLISSFNEISPFFTVPPVQKVEFGRIKPPALATGAVIPPNQQFMAILGDQKSGRNLEAPEGLIRELFQEEMEKYMGGSEITINFGGDMAHLVRLLKPYIDRENSRAGAKLITGGAY